MATQQINIPVPLSFVASVKKLTDNVQKFTGVMQNVSTTQMINWGKTYNQMGVQLSKHVSLYSRMTTQFHRLGQAFTMSISRIVYMLGPFGRFFMRSVAAAGTMLSAAISFTSSVFGIGALALGTGIGVSKWIWDRMVGLGDAMLQDYLVSSGLLTTIERYRAFRATFGFLPDDPNMLRNIAEARGRVTSPQANALQMLEIWKITDVTDVAVKAMVAVSRFMKKQPQGQDLIMAEAFLLTSIFNRQTLTALRDLSEEELKYYVELYEKNKDKVRVTKEAQFAFMGFSIQVRITTMSVESSIAEGLSRSGVIKSLEKLSQAFANLVKRFIESKTFEKVQVKLASYLDRLANWFLSGRAMEDVKKIINQVTSIIRTLTDFYKWLTGSSSKKTSLTMGPGGDLIRVGGPRGMGMAYYRGGGPRAEPAVYRPGGDGTSVNYPRGEGRGPDPRGLIPYIRETAIKYGIDPDIAVRVARSEGLTNPVGDRRTSFGAFQLHVTRGGGAVGDLYRKETGRDPSDPKNEKDTIDFALRHARKYGWGAWNGAKRIHVYGFTGINRNKPITATPAPAPAPASTPPIPAPRPDAPLPSARPSGAPAPPASPLPASRPDAPLPAARPSGAPAPPAPPLPAARPSAPPAAVSTVAPDGSVRTFRRSDVNDAIESAARSSGINPAVLFRIARVESGGDPHQRTHSYKGLFQLSDKEFRENGGKAGLIYDPAENARVAVIKFKKENAELSRRLGRPITDAEMYLVHQQGVAGAYEHLTHPNQPAWKSMLATEEGRQKGERWAKRAIWGNIADQDKARFGNVNNVTSQQFTEYWRNKTRLGGKAVATDTGGAPAPSVESRPGHFVAPGKGVSKTWAPPGHILIVFPGVEDRYDTKQFEKDYTSYAQSRGMTPVFVHTVEEAKQAIAKNGGTNFSVYGFSKGAKTADNLLADPEIKKNAREVTLIAPYGGSNFPNVQGHPGLNIYPDGSSGNIAPTGEGYRLHGKHASGPTQVAAGQVHPEAQQKPVLESTAGSEKYSVVRGTGEGADPRLYDLVRETSRYLPEGWSVKVESGRTARVHGTPWHPSGVAVDVGIYDEKGHKVDWYQNPHTFPVYQAFAHKLREIQQQKYPELNRKLSWGGYFGGHLGHYGTMDLMHFDLGGTRGTAGTFERGLSPEAAHQWGVEHPGLPPDIMKGKVGIGPLQLQDPNKGPKDLEKPEPSKPGHFVPRDTSKSISSDPEHPKVKVENKSDEDVHWHNINPSSHEGIAM